MSYADFSLHSLISLCMKTLQKYFRSTLSDKYVELSMRQSEREEFFTQLANEIRKEMEEATEDERLITLNKIFLVAESTSCS